MSRALGHPRSGPLFVPFLTFLRLSSTGPSLLCPSLLLGSTLVGQGSDFSASPMSLQDAPWPVSPASPLKGPRGEVPSGHDGDAPPWRAQDSDFREVPPQSPASFLPPWVLVSVAAAQNPRKAAKWDPEGHRAQGVAWGWSRRGPVAAASSGQRCSGTTLLLLHLESSGLWSWSPAQGPSATPARRWGPGSFEPHSTPPVPWQACPGRAGTSSAWPVLFQPAERCLGAEQARQIQWEGRRGLLSSLLVLAENAS